mmetsp:Transcript_20632/g.22852  ORF Transcript_20632/g.22852 Transcript_20632/m.22852 type:complete len:265 (+) Transcript_20632:43-837(+)
MNMKMAFDIGNTVEIQQKRNCSSNSNTVLNASSCEKLELLSRTAALANQQQESIVESRNVPFSTVVLRSPISTDADEAVGTSATATAMATADSIATATNNNVATSTIVAANHLVRATSHTNLMNMSTSSHLVETIRSPVPTLLGSSAQSSPLAYSPLPPYGHHNPNPNQNPFTIPRRNSQDHLHHQDQHQHQQHPQYQLQQQTNTLPVPSSSSLSSYGGHTNPFVLRQRDQELHHHHQEIDQQLHHQYQQQQQHQQLQLPSHQL